LFAQVNGGIPDARYDDLPFKVVRTNSHDEVIARAINLIVGRAAYETACRLYPNERVDYRDGARIIARSEPQSKV
jgi:hypothetical protein